MGEVASPGKSNLVSVDTVESEPVDELTLFGVVSPSSSEGDTIKDDIKDELDKGLDKDIDEGFESLYQLGTEIIKKYQNRQ